MQGPCLGTAWASGSLTASTTALLFQHTATLRMSTGWWPNVPPWPIANRAPPMSAPRSPGTAGSTLPATRSRPPDRYVPGPRRNPPILANGSPWVPPRPSRGTRRPRRNPVRNRRLRSDQFSASRTWRAAQSLLRISQRAPIISGATTAIKLMPRLLRTEREAIRAGRTAIEAVGV